VIAVAHAAEIWDDIVEVVGTENDSDEVADTFPTEGRSVEQIIAELKRRYGALAPTYVRDNRTDPPTTRDATRPQGRILELKVLITGLNPEDDLVILCDEVETALGELGISTGWKFEVPYP
jgi:hypothetical protein